MKTTMNHVRVVEGDTALDVQAKANGVITLNRDMKPINISHSYVPETRKHVIVILFEEK